MIKPGILYYLLILSCFVIFPITIYGQHELLIPAPTGPGDYLDAHIVGDTTVTGERLDLERVYVLERNGVYIVVNTVRPDGWDIRMKAQDGEGPLPVIYQLKNPTSGNMTDEVFRIVGAGGNV